MSTNLQILALLLVSLTYSQVTMAESTSSLYDVLKDKGIHQYMCDVLVVDNYNKEIAGNIPVLASDETEGLKFCLIKINAVSLGGSNDVYVELPGWGDRPAKVLEISVRLEKN